MLKKYLVNEFIRKYIPQLRIANKTIQQILQSVYYVLSTRHRHTAEVKIHVLVELYSKRRHK